MERILKNTFNVLLLMSFMFSCFYINVEASDGYIDIYYNDKKETEISEGVTKITDKMLTSKGIVDVNIIKIDLDNEDIKFENLDNDTETGKKTTLTNLVATRENVIAAINGDFFEMYLTPSLELGITMNNGELERLSTGEYYNYYSNSLAALFINSSNKPSIDYIKIPVTFSNSKDTLYLSYVNKLGNNEGTVYLSGKFFKSSIDMDNRNPNTYKIVVKDDRITQIIEPEINIDIAEDEYVIFLPVNFDRIQNFEVGDKVEFKIDSEFIKDKITAIGGASRILFNGEIISDGYIITSRTCRSFAGYDNSYLYIGTVGGRTTANVGVTHNELGEILKRYGIKYAMHLDGGGSTELIAKQEFNSTLSILNNISSERAILNSLAVTNSSKSSKIVGIKLELESDKLIKDSRNSYKVYGYNANHNDIEIDIDDVTIECDGAKIDKDKNIITFDKDGRYEITATYKKMEDTISVDVYDTLTEVIILPDPINIEVGSEKELTIYALTEEKYKIKLDTNDCEYIISPPNIAKVVDGKVVGLKEGAGTIGVSFNDLEAYSLLTVGYEDRMLENFSYGILESVVYPDTVKSTISNDSGKLKMEYRFEESEETQAAYAKFTYKVEIPKEALRIKLDLKGDKSNNILKVKLVDDKETVYNITLCENINFKNTKTLVADLPTDYSGKLCVERIYVVSMSSNDTYSSEIKIDSLEYVIPYDGSAIKVIESVKREAKTKDNTIEKLEDEYFVFLNNARSKSLHSNYIDNLLGKKLDKYEDLKLILARETDNLEGQAGYGKFESEEYDDTLIVSLSTIAGSVYSKDPYQYVRLENLLNDIEADNIIITLDGDLTSSNFTTDKTMLEYVLNKYYKQRRVNFYVVCFAGDTSNEKVSNGIKYIRVPENLNNALSKNVLVFKDDDGSLSYNLISLADMLNDKEEEKVDEE